MSGNGAARSARWCARNHWMGNRCARQAGCRKGEKIEHLHFAGGLSGVCVRHPAASYTASPQGHNGTKPRTIQEETTTKHVKVYSLGVEVYATSSRFHRDRRVPYRDRRGDLLCRVETQTPIDRELLQPMLTHLFSAVDRQTHKRLSSARALVLRSPEKRDTRTGRHAVLRQLLSHAFRRVGALRRAYPTLGSAAHFVYREPLYTFLYLPCQNRFPVLAQPPGRQRRRCRVEIRKKRTG